MSDETFVPQPGSSNSHELAPIASDEWQQIEQAYREIQRRDDRAEYRICEPVARRARFGLGLTPRQRANDLRDQNGDHPAAREPHERRETADSKILGA